MVRQNRWSIRLSFIVILVMATFGLWFAVTYWWPAFDNVDLSVFTNTADWIEFLAAIGEEAVQLFLGVTSGQ